MCKAAHRSTMDTTIGAPFGDGKIFDETPSAPVYVAAYWVWYRMLRRPRGFVMDHVCWSPSFETATMRFAVEPESGNVCHVGRSR
jgi:hypothetical protein